MIAICHLITSLDVGGAERALVNLVQRLPQSHFRNEVISLVKPGLLAEELNDAGVPVASLDMPRGSATAWGLGRLVRHLRATRPTILQTWLYHADLLGIAAKSFVPGLRILWNLRCTDMVSAPESRKLNRNMKLLALLSHRPDAVIVNSESGKAFHKAFGYNSRRWVQITNGVDTKHFRPRADARKATRAALGVEPQAYIVGMVARFHPMKDHQTFLRAAAKFSLGHPSAQFVLCGQGCDNSNEHLMQMIAETGLIGRVVLLGMQRNVETLYPSFDLLTLTSAYGEGSPNVLLEAMACGVPCVSTDVGDARQIVGDTGLIVARRDPERLAAAWEAVANLDCDSLARGARARAVENYRIDKICLEYEMLYRDLALTPLDLCARQQSAAEQIDQTNATSIRN